MIRVKICGITNLEDALFCESAGADALGFIFSEVSPRRINEDDAKNIFGSIGPFTIKVGVFVDEDKEKVLDSAQRLNLDVLQFHGSESPEYCDFFRGKFDVVKTFFPAAGQMEKQTSGYRVNAFLFDVKYEDKQKRVKVLSPQMLNEIEMFIKKGNRVIVSGGLTSENVLNVKKMFPYAVDIASGVEASVGKKDKNLVTEFIRKIKTV